MIIKVSIVIPVFNGEEYLEQCLRSVLSQTLQELEILCVDDGSTDRSAELVRRMQKEDARIQLIRQENQGAGSARNRALQEARGLYVAFLDADDFYIEPDALERMVRLCEGKELFVCGSLRKRLQNGNITAEELFPGVRVNEILDYHEYQMDYHYQSFLFRREHLLKNEIFFPNYRRFQDPPFFVKALYTAGSFIIADTCLYCYRWSDMEPRFNRQKTMDLLRGLIENLRFASLHGLEILFRNTLQRLEDEYTDIICKNISPDDLQIWELLIEANQVVCAHCGKKDYVIQPLRVFQFALRQERYRNALLERIHGEEEFAVYGAGKYGKLLLKFLQKNHLHHRMIGFLVSDQQGNATQIEEFPVRAFRDCPEAKHIFLLVAVRGGIQEEVQRFLEEKECRNYWIIREEFLHVLAAELEGL